MLNFGTALFNKNLEKVSRGTFKNKIIKHFPETYMGYSHETLQDIAFEADVNLRKLGPGEYVIFTNKSMTAAKLFACGNVYAYLRMPGTAKLDDDIIRNIPRFFGGSEIGTRAFDKAVVQ